MEVTAKLLELHSDLDGTSSDHERPRGPSPGVDWHATNGAMAGQGDRHAWSHPRTYPYWKLLPYDTEDEPERLKDLEDILTRLYIAVEAGDFTPGAVHWSRELRGWLTLKFDLPRPIRIKLVRFFYELALAPGIDPAVAERFASMFMVLTKKKHYLRPVDDLTLDWRPLLRELKVFVLPQESGMVHTTALKRNVRTLTKLCTFAQMYLDPRDTPTILRDVLPYFSASFIESAFVVTGLLSLMMPTTPASADDRHLYPQEYLPTLFHLWSLVNRSKVMDVQMVDLMSRMARDALLASHVPFSEHGIFTAEQSSLIFTAFLRLLEIPVGQATSPYASSVDFLAGMASLLERDPRKHPITHQMARWIVMSLSPACLDQPRSIITHLEGLVQAIETFFHPSNSGSWTKNLAHLVHYLADFFVMRWNRERSGEMDVPPSRRLNDALKRRFVLSLRDVIFMGIYSKSGTAMTFSLSTLQVLAHLEPGLILPGALQRIYPSMQGLVEVHRTTSSLRSLQVLARTMVRTKGFRCHVTSLLGLALPGVDANDLEKTLHTLSFIQSACYNLPFHDLTRPHDHLGGSSLAVDWVTSEVDRMERDGSNVELDYVTTLSDPDEEMILRSSTAGFGEFLISFLGRVFTLLENLPDASRVRSGSPEENVVNTLPATFTPLLASLSPDLYDLALGKIADFVSTHVIHQARDAMAFVCNALCKVDPSKALKRLVPMLIQAIRSEIDENGAASTRTTGTDVLPRDRALVWNISMLSMCLVHVGDPVLAYREELSSIAQHMQERCKGIPTVHVSNLIHHLLLNLTAIYPVDYSLYEPTIVRRGLQPEHWGYHPRPSDLTIHWHVPTQAELEFAVSLFESQADGAIKQLEALIGNDPPVKRDGTGRAWSDEVTRILVLLRLLLAGISILFDPKVVVSSNVNDAKSIGNGLVQHTDNDHPSPPTDDDDDDDDDGSVLDAEDQEPKPVFHYPTGYPLKDGEPMHTTVHELRDRVGELLHQVHGFLTEKQEDDVSCFTALYTAYRSWFIDVGMERSAHVLDRVMRLLASDIHPYKVSGLRKEYPRPLLLRRAHVYHLQRLRHNATPRPRSDLDERLLMDLATSSVSLYTDIRKNAQSAGESAIKTIIGARPLVIPPLLESLKEAVDRNDYPRIKGAIFALQYGSLSKAIGRDWRFASSLIRSFITISTVDKPSIQKLTAGAIFQVMEWGRPLDRMAILKPDVIKALAPPDPVDERIAEKLRRVQRKRKTMEARKAEFALELVELATDTHWKKASRAGAIIINLGLRYDMIAPEPLMRLLTSGTIDPHPAVRGLLSGGLVALFSLIEMRAVSDHDHENYLLDKQTISGKVQIPTKRDDPEWTKQFLAGFAQPETKYYVDHDYPGWLLWGPTIPAYRAEIDNSSKYDEIESNARSYIGHLLTRDWFTTFFGYLKQEPRDNSADRFRMATAVLLVYAFGLMLDRKTAATFSDIKEEIAKVYEDGSDKHQHRATAEIMGALLTAVVDEGSEKREEVWAYAFPIVRNIYSDGLTPENLSYWVTFLHLVLQGRDPRRAWPIFEWLTEFRLDLSSNAAFKESSKIDLLHQCVGDAGWHFRLGGPVLSDFLDHLDHPYKGVRESMGHTLAAIYRTRYHESYRDVDTLVQAQKEASSIGTRPWEPSEEYSSAIRDVFGRLERWRHERTPGQQTPSSYTSGSKTTLIWLDATLTGFECTMLVPFFSDVIMEQLLHMMDVKEDPELMTLAYLVFRHLPNVPHRAGESQRFIDALIQIGRTAPLWHQRLRILINIQVIYFRQLFLVTSDEQQALFDCVSEMLEDSQPEVRLGAATTLSGMIRCSPVSLRESVIPALKKRYTKMLRSSPLPKRSPTGTPTPEHTKIIVGRHAAVLGLGALIQAFPYTSPPPTWLPDVLAFLAVKAAADPGMVGKSVKTIISDFKKTRQDTWHVDVKAFNAEQLGDLEGVLWKSYFA